MCQLHRTDNSPRAAYALHLRRICWIYPLTGREALPMLKTPMSATFVTSLHHCSFVQSRHKPRQSDGMLPRPSCRRGGAGRLSSSAPRLQVRVPLRSVAHLDAYSRRIRPMLYGTCPSCLKTVVPTPVRSVLRAESGRSPSRPSGATPVRGAYWQRPIRAVRVYMPAVMKQR